MDNSDGNSWYSSISSWIYFEDDYGHSCTVYWHQKYREHWEISHGGVQTGAENEVVKNTKMNLAHGWCLKMLNEQSEQRVACCREFLDKATKCGCLWKLLLWLVMSLLKSLFSFYRQIYTDWSGKENLFGVISNLPQHLKCHLTQISICRKDLFRVLVKYIKSFDCNW